MDATKLLFRPSSLGDLMTGTAKGWSVEDSLTCKRKLVKIFREIKYGRYYTHVNKYTEKGVKMEEDGITLYSLVKKIPHTKNKERLTNDYFTGEPDIITDHRTVDIKCSWSLDTFPHPLLDKVDAGYEYQGYGYMDLTGATEHIIAYCLVNAPANLILKAKEMLWYNMNCPTEENEDYHKGKITIEKNMIFDMDQFIRDNPTFDCDCKEWQYDIPREERVIEFTTTFDESKMQKIKNRLNECRDWMITNKDKL